LMEREEDTRGRLLQEGSSFLSLKNSRGRENDRGIGKQREKKGNANLQVSSQGCRFPNRDLTRKRRKAHVECILPRRGSERGSGSIRERRVVEGRPRVLFLRGLGNMLERREATIKKVTNGNCSAGPLECNSIASSAGGAQGKKTEKEGRNSQEKKKKRDSPKKAWARIMG